MTRKLKLPEGKGINKRGSSFPLHPDSLFLLILICFCVLKGMVTFQLLLFPPSRIDTFIHGGQKGQVVHHLFLTAVWAGIPDHLNLICTPGGFWPYAPLYSLWIIRAVQSAAQFPQMEHQTRGSKRTREWIPSPSPSLACDPACMALWLFFPHCHFLPPPRIGNILSEKQSRQET